MEFSIEFTGIHCLHRAMVRKILETLTMLKSYINIPSDQNLLVVREANQGLPNED